jgi:hypothetical protein
MGVNPDFVQFENYGFSEQIVKEAFSDFVFSVEVMEEFVDWKQRGIFWFDFLARGVQLDLFFFFFEMLESVDLAFVEAH